MMMAYFMVLASKFIQVDSYAIDEVA